MILKFLATIILMVTYTLAFGQNNRINTYQKIGWFNYFGTYKLTNKFGFHTEYQWRRNNIIKHWQQSLLRMGINYQFNPRILFRAGYAWVETFPYGDFPINGLGRDFTEHRIFQMIQLAHKEGIVDISTVLCLNRDLLGNIAL